jgi:small neutral amino acid transporter SnatA (MarC family)
VKLEEVFVGCVSSGIGLTALAAAIWNWEASFQMRAARLIEHRWGRLAARIAYAVLGVLLVCLGVAIGLGFGPNKS